MNKEGKGMIGGMTSIVGGAMGGLKGVTKLGKFLIDDKEEDEE
jgi:hypothetical protein